MALNIKRRRVDELARRSATLRDVSITDAVEAALERDVIELEATRTQRADDYLAGLQDRMAKLPVRDPRSTREIQDELNQDVFDSHGLGDFVRR